VEVHTLRDCVRHEMFDNRKQNALQKSMNVRDEINSH
jgi:hypothetical protein